MGYVKINGIKKSDTEISLSELTQLCDEFVSNKNHIPYNCEFNSKWNLPTVTSTKKLLSENNLTLDEFLNRYKDIKITVFDNEEYDNYLNKYKYYSDMIGRPLGEKEVTKYDLPCVEWFITHCPNQKVRMWNDFVEWCGYKQNNNVSKEVAIKMLTEYDNTTDRPILKKDLCKVGISISTILKYWGSFSKCKQELGLKLSPKNGNKKSFDDYKNRLDCVIKDCKSREKYRITWEDILHNKFGGFDYYSLKKSFNENNLNVVDYIQNNGLTFWKSGKGKESNYMFPDGESTSSSYEYDLSSFLKNINFVYDRDYTRNVLYKNIIKEQLTYKIDCDYLFYDTFVVEIAGMFTHLKGDWHTHNCKSKRESDYLKKMLWKERLLLENNIPFLFLFPEDFQDDSAYQPKVIEFILSNLHKYQLIQK